MEFRDFCRIFVERRALFLLVTVSFLLVALGAYRFQPERHETSLLLNVARIGSRETNEYTYDQFYRLQADERFADTVVRWLGEPSVLEMIRERSGSDAGVVGTLSAKRLSSQMISVRYRAASEDAFVRVAEAVVGVLNDESSRLNERSRDADWFTIVADEPVVRDARFTFSSLFLSGAVAGLFFAFWVVLIVWYFRGPLGKADAKR